VQIERQDVDPTKDEVAQAHVRVVLTRSGASVYAKEAPIRAWALVGNGDPPRQMQNARIGSLSLHGYTIDPALTWIAGVWSDPKQALAAAQALDPAVRKRAGWLAINPRGETTITGPDHTRATVTLRLHPDPSPPAHRPVHP
jgi:hypothetical protein